MKLEVTFDYEGSLMDYYYNEVKHNKKLTNVVAKVKHEEINDDLS
ncbi:hypothetical protein LCGC14_0547580 [marine sediment metagenome]|uniref:Uncharacterized protein n=1 Tax=marine sediment metagenome TaxID=412755 RepID=A0A0F9UC81_9ZZZZ